MPNGDPDFHVNEEPKLEAFFSPIADILIEFAQRRNLRMEKYYHQSPSWDFTFKHPQGGVGKIEASRETDTSLSLHCIWWHDDYDRVTRSLKRLKGEPLLREPQALRDALEKSLKTILSWQFGQWDDEYGGYHDWKSHWTKAQFDSQMDLYPVPKI